MKKKILSVFAMLLCVMAVVIINTDDVYAAGSFKVSGSGEVESGGTKTITITVTDCEGRFSISASNGGSVSSESEWVSGSTSITVTAPKSGSTTVTVTAEDVTDTDLKAVTGSKTVKITVAEEEEDTSSNNNSSNDSSSNDSSSNDSSSNDSSSSETTTPTVTESSNSNLIALSLNEGEISPEFYYATTSYTATVWDVDTVTINATKEHSAATILSGTGEQAVEVGENELNIVVEAENGYIKTYTIVVTVEESSNLVFTLDGGEYVIKRTNEDVVIPDGFAEETITIEDEEVTVWTSNLLGMTLIYLSNGDGEADFYLYDEETGIISEFIQLGILGRNVYVVEISEEEQVREGMVYELVTVDGNKIMGWTFEDEALSDYTVICVMDDTGNMVSYLYCISDKSMIPAPDMAPVSVDTYTELLNTLAAPQEEESTEIVATEGITVETMYLQIAAGIIALLLLLTIIFFVLFIKNRSKYLALLDREEESDIQYIEGFDGDLDGEDDFQDVDETDLDKEDLDEVDFDEVDLDEADLDEVDLDEADLDEADLDEEDLDEVDLDEVDLDEEDLDEAEVEDEAVEAIPVRKTVSTFESYDLDIDTIKTKYKVFED